MHLGRSLAERLSIAWCCWRKHFYDGTTFGLEQNTLHDSDMVWRDGFGYERHLGQDLATCSTWRNVDMQKAILSHCFLLARM
jgi:hypothetical protein